MFEITLPHESDDLKLYTKCEDDKGLEGIFIQQI